VLNLRGNFKEFSPVLISSHNYQQNLSYRAAKVDAKGGKKIVTRVVIISKTMHPVDSCG
jgi:hypothetical protein